MVHWAQVFVGRIRAHAHTNSGPLIMEYGHKCLCHTHLPDLGIQMNTLYGLPFIVKANLKPDWKRQLAQSDIFDDELNIVMERPQLIPPEDLDHSDPNRKIFMTQNGEAMDLDSPDDLVA